MSEPITINILYLPRFLKEIKPHLKNPNMDISNNQMQIILGKMLTGVSAEEVAEDLNNCTLSGRPTIIIPGSGG